MEVLQNTIRQMRLCCFLNVCLGRDGEMLGRHGGRNIWRGSGRGGWIWEGQVNVVVNIGKCGGWRRNMWKGGWGEGGIWEGKWTGSGDNLESRWKWREQYGEGRWTGTGTGGRNMGRRCGRRRRNMWKGGERGGRIMGRWRKPRPWRMGSTEKWPSTENIRDVNKVHDEWATSRSGHLPRTSEMSTRTMTNGFHREVAIYREHQRCQPGPWRMGYT